MTTGPEAVRAIATATNLPVGTVDRVARVLKQHKPMPLWARSIPGNGAQSEHVDALRLSNILLGFAGNQPSDAAEAVTTLAALEFYKTEESASPRLMSNLGRVIEQIIQGLADQTVQPETGVSGSKTLYLPDLVFSVNPPWAEIRWPSADSKTAYVESYKPGVGKPYTVTPWIVSRQTRIGWEMLAAMGELLADTIQQQRDMPKNTKAAGAPPPNGLRAKSKQAAKPVPVDAEQLTHSPKSGQSRQVRGLPSSPLVER